MSSTESPKLRASSSSAFRTPAPVVSRLIVIRQQSPSTETLIDGSKLPVVQKNVPFEVVLGSPPGNPPTSLAEFGLDARLFLATPDGEGSEVAAAKSKALEYQARPSSTGDQLFVTLRINALSSRHEGSCFKIRFSITEPGSQKVIPSLTCSSSPIKIVHNKTSEQPPPKRTKQAHASAIETILEKLEGQCATEATIIADRVDMEQALTILFTQLSTLKPDERVKKLAQLLDALPLKERELARSIGQAMQNDLNELEGFPVLNLSTHTLLIAPPTLSNLYRSSTNSMPTLRITNALSESSDRISLSASQAGLAGTDPEFYRTLQ